MRRFRIALVYPVVFVAVFVGIAAHMLAESLGDICDGLIDWAEGNDEWRSE
jgi:hypothetical protein